MPQQREAIDLITPYGQYGLLPIGSLNYLITNILLAKDPKSYTDYNALIGVIECCKLEFYRRAVAAYEDEKIAENSDVY